MRFDPPALRALPSNDRSGAHDLSVIDSRHVVEADFEESGQRDDGFKAQTVIRSKLQFANGRGRESGLFGQFAFKQVVALPQAGDSPG